MSSLTPRINRLEKNLLINGAFHFWQRGASSTSINHQISDRFRFFSSETHTITADRVDDVPSGYGLPHSMRFVINTAPSPSATSFSQFYYNGVERRDIAPYIGGHKFALHFWTKSSLVGQRSIWITAKDSVNSYSFPTSYTVNVANTWERKLIIIDTPPIIAEANSGQYGFGFNIISSDATNHDDGTPNQWQLDNSSSYRAVPGNVNFDGTAGASQHFTGFQLRPFDISGPTPTVDSFDAYVLAGNNYANELELCQRYFRKSYDLDTAPGTVTQNGCLRFRSPSVNTSIWSPWKIDYGSHMRLVPTRLIYSTATGAVNFARNNDTAADISASATSGGTSGFIVTGTAVLGESEILFHWTADAEL